MAKTAKKTSAKTAEQPVANNSTDETLKTGPGGQATATENPANPGEQDNSQLTITDLQMMAQAINLAVRRGAYDASEVGEIGAIYSKLSKFLQIVAEQVKKPEGGK